MRGKSIFAGGLGVEVGLPDRMQARERLGIDPSREMILAVSGGGGSGFAAAPLALGARATPDASWMVVGQVVRDWHATVPSNLSFAGWVDNMSDYLAAADLVVASTGNTTCQQILAAGLPWIAVPEWRYFDEQIAKASALHQAGAAWHLPTMPASLPAWRAAIAAARANHDAELQRSMVRPDAAKHVADWLEALAIRLDLSQTQLVHGA